MRTVPSRAEGNRGTEGAARGGHCGAKGYEQRDGGQEGVVSWGGGGQLPG